MFMIYVLIFFLFKQKTAYEMRISDWSSDVSSSDLAGRRTRDFTGSSVGDIRRLVAVENGELARQLGLASTLVIVNEVMIGRGAAVDALPVSHDDDVARSEERRVGQAGVSLCRSRW